jgi:DNA-binding SARP family transcriptional activator
MCHPGGVTEELLFEDVLGDVPGSKVRPRLNTYVYNLQQQLRAVGGPGNYLSHTARGRIGIDGDRIDCDLWRMRGHLRDADRARNIPARIALLRRGVDEYTGPLAGDADYYWITPVREAVRGEAIRAHVALAELLADTDRNAALVVLGRAIGHDPYNEALYVQAMRLHAAAADTDGVRAVFGRLTGSLREIGVQPAADTAALANLAGPRPGR